MFEKSIKKTSSGEIGLNISWVAVATPTNRPKSVYNCCVIEVFCGVFVLSRCFLDFSVDVGAIVMGLSQTSSFYISTLEHKYQIWTVFFIIVKCMNR